MPWLSNREGLSSSETPVTARKLQPQQTAAQRQPGAVSQTWE